MAKPRSAWKGAIAFGLLNVPVRLVKATEDQDIHFKLLHDADNGRITMPRVCATCNEKVTSDQISQGIEIDSEKIVKFTEDELDNLPVGSLGMIRLCAIDKDPDPIRIDASYFVVPEKTGERALSIVASAMLKTKKSLQGAVTIRHKERPCYLWMRGGEMVLSTLRFPSEIRHIDDIELPKAPKEQVDMALELLATLPGDVVDHDTYAEAVTAMAVKKAAGEVISVPQKSNGASEAPQDILEALKASVAAAKKGRK